MKVLVCPLEDDASAWYRLCWPATALAAQGADVAVGKLPAGIWRDTPGQLPKLETLTDSPDADLYDEANTIYRPGGRVCRTCEKARKKRRRERAANARTGSPDGG